MPINNKITVSVTAWMHVKDFEFESHHGKASNYWAWYFSLRFSNQNAATVTLWKQCIIMTKIVDFEQVLNDEETDELAPYFRREFTPKVLITSSVNAKGVSFFSWMSFSEVIRYYFESKVSGLIHLSLDNFRVEYFTIRAQFNAWLSYMYY